MSAAGTRVGPYKEGPGVADNVGHSRAVVGRKRDIADGATDWQPDAHGREQNPLVSSRRLRSGPSPGQGPSGRTLPPPKAMIEPCLDRAQIEVRKLLQIKMLQQFKLDRTTLYRAAILSQEGIKHDTCSGNGTTPTDLSLWVSPSDRERRPAAALGCRTPRPRVHSPDAPG